MRGFFSQCWDVKKCEGINVNNLTNSEILHTK